MDHCGVCHFPTEMGGFQAASWPRKCFFFGGGYPRHKIIQVHVGLSAIDGTHKVVVFPSVSQGCERPPRLYNRPKSPFGGRYNVCPKGTQKEHSIFTIPYKRHTQSMLFLPL